MAARDITHTIDGKVFERVHRYDMLREKMIKLRLPHVVQTVILNLFWPREMQNFTRDVMKKEDGSITIGSGYVGETYVSFHYKNGVFYEETSPVPPKETTLTETARIQEVINEIVGDPALCTEPADSTSWWPQYWFTYLFPVGTILLEARYPCDVIYPRLEGSYYLVAQFKKDGKVHDLFINTTCPKKLEHVVYDDVPSTTTVHTLDSLQARIYEIGLTN